MRKRFSRKKLLSYSSREVRHGRVEGSRFFHRFISCLFLLVLLFIFYFVFYSDFFKIKKIILIDNEKVSEQEIFGVFEEISAGRRFFVFPGKNIIVFSKGEFKKRILERILKIERVQVEKKYPDILKVKIVEKKPVAIWSSGGKNYYLDEEGVIAYEISSPEEKLPIIQDLSGKKVSPRQKAVFKETLDFIREIAGNFSSKTGREIEVFKLSSPAAEEIHLKVKDGFEVYFSLKRNPRSQLEDLVLVLTHQIKEKKVSYIDLRIENRVYYK